MKKLVIEMLKRAKPWGIVLVITAICWLISFFMNGENGITLLWMSISLMLGVILIAHFILIVFPHDRNIVFFADFIRQARDTNNLGIE